MRICIITNIFDSWGGSEELWAAMALKAIESGNQLMVSYFDSGPLHPKMNKVINAGCICKGRRGYVKPGLNIFKRILKKIKIQILNYLDSPYKAVRKFNPEIIIHNGSSYQFCQDKLFFTFIKNKTYSLIILNHIIPDNIRNISQIERDRAIQLLNVSKINFFVSKRNLTTAERQLVFKISNAEIIRNPVNISFPKYLPYPASEVYTFAVIGNLLVNHKGQDILLQALSMQTWKNENWNLNIFGSGLDSEYIQQLITFYGLNGKVKIAGRTEDIESVWSTHHLLIMPSIMEGTPLAMVEAMLCGRTVLITDVGGASEWIEDGDNGFIAEGTNEHSISAALERMWVKRSYWEEMGKKANTKALSQYDSNPGQTLLNKILNISN